MTARPRPPVLIIVLAFEAPVAAFLDADSGDDFLRLADWLDASGSLDATSELLRLRREARERERREAEGGS